MSITQKFDNKNKQLVFLALLFLKKINLSDPYER